MTTLEAIEAKLDFIHEDVKETKDAVQELNGRVREVETSQEELPIVSARVQRHSGRIRGVELEQARQDERNALNHWLNRGISVLLAAIASYLGIQN